MTVCSGPEDGPRCRQGVKHLLILKTPSVRIRGGRQMFLSGGGGGQHDRKGASEYLRDNPRVGASRQRHVID